MNRKYSGFTLVEMLIVMGIIIILMVVGITAGRFAINRANDVAHRNVVDQIYVSLQAYYTDERKYPAHADGEVCGASDCTVQMLVGTPSGNPGTLVPYFDQDSFDGGSTSSYFYGVGGDGGNQAVLVCVTLRGDVTENVAHNDGAVYCSGNGLGVALDFTSAASVTIPVSEMDYATYSADTAWTGIHAITPSTWDGDTWQ